MELRDYQVADLVYYMMNPRCGNFSDPGTGKTPPTCVYMSWLWTEKMVRTIWAMPKTLMKKNREELLLWSEFEPDDVVIVDGTPKQREKQMATDAKVFICSYTCFASNWPRMVEHHPDIDALVGDEWHLGFKSDSSQRSQSMYEFMNRSTFLVAMTGTIVDGRLDTAYPFINVAAPGTYSNWFSFKMAHAIENDYGQVVAWRNHHRIGEVFRKTAIRHSFEEVYGPEAKVIVPEFCEMAPKQREAYDEFEEFALLELEDEFLSGEQPGVNQIRCRQLMEHPQEFGPPLDKIKQTGKEERLEVHLEDHLRTGKPLVIFAAFRPQHDRLRKQCEKYGFRVGVINGGVSSKKRFEIDEQFRRGELDIVIASAATAGVGFNWGHVDHMIFMSIDPMDSNFVQAYRRAIRGQRETPLRITMPRYENSRVEDRIFELVEEKSALAHAVDDTKERIRFERPKQKAKKSPPPDGFTMADLISRN